MDVRERVYRAAHHEELRKMKHCRGEKEMDMEDKILDDDDIIDLTDLLEEGEPKKKEREKKTGSPSHANEPDSFDLGKEISMEYEVSVEEIEQGSEGIDIDASLSSNEEVALTREKEGGEDTLKAGETGETIFDDNRERGMVEADLSGDGSSEAILQEDEKSVCAGSEKDVVDILEAVPEKTEGKAAGEPIQESVAEVGSVMELIAEKPVIEEPKDVSNIIPGGKEPGAGLSSESVRELVLPQMTEKVIDELKNEVPAMLEGIVKPLIAELVKEMVVATREHLPGIVEKVIREEIEKLKKLDS